MQSIVKFASPSRQSENGESESNEDKRPPGCKTAKRMRLGPDDDAHKQKIDVYEKRNQTLQEANDIEIMSKSDDEISKEYFRLLKLKKLNELKAKLCI